MALRVPASQGGAHEEAKMTPGILDRFRTLPTIPHPSTFAGPAQVRAYWEGLRRKAALPTRAALDPRGLGGVLDRVFLAEGIGTGLARVRIAGSALTEFAGTDLRGLPLSCLFTPTARPVLADALEPVLAGTALAEIDLGSDRSHPGQPVARLLLLPLVDKTGGRQVLGVIGLAPAVRSCKLEVLARRSERLSLAPVACPPASGPAPLAAPATPSAGRRGHLRLVHFNA
jgi:hypothetical protein